MGYCTLPKFTHEQLCIRNRKVAAARRLNADKRFWSKIDKTGSCWLWRGSGRPYGRMVWKDGKVMGVHRISFMLHNGYLPKDLMICHHCDTPLCVRPEHLFAGTNDDNQKDAARKGRYKGRKLPPRSQEWRDNLSKAKKGKTKLSDETRRRMSIGQRSIVKSEWAKEMARQGLKRYWEKRRLLNA